MYVATVNLVSSTTRQLPFTGVMLRGALLAIIKESQPELACLLHDAPGIRPFSLSLLTPHRRDFATLLIEGRTYQFRVTFLEEHIMDTMLEFLTRDRPVFNLLGAELTTSHVELDRVTFLDLVADSSTPIYSFSLRFLTPTCFSAWGSDVHYLYPDPVKVFPNLLRLWNRFCPSHALPRTSVYYDWVARNVIVTSYSLRTRTVRLGEARRTAGFIGVCHYRIRHTPQNQALAAFTNTLCRFGELANVGNNRTAGFGVVRYIPGGSLGRPGSPAPELAEAQKGEGAEASAHHSSPNFSP